ncbi:DUF2085 domain-containing protein [Gracilimonas mengyeensis]|nr:DUF2085 domain-containing protein [Gracilimonas mengyeensis]
MHNQKLYAITLGLAGFTVIAALGPGLFGDTAYTNQWQYMIFKDLCHQDPTRSFNISGVQMAVCARCIGIYGAFLVGWLTMPIYGFFAKKGSAKEKYWLIAAILLNLIDVVGNYFGLWTNTHVLRLVLGGVLGWCLMALLANEFFTFNKSEYGYGY